MKWLKMSGLWNWIRRGNNVRKGIPKENNYTYLSEKDAKAFKNTVNIIKEAEIGLAKEFGLDKDEEFMKGTEKKVEDLGHLLFGASYEITGARINNDKELEREVRSKVGRWLMGKSFIYFGEAMKYYGIEGHEEMNKYGIELIQSFDLKESKFKELIKELEENVQEVDLPEEYILPKTEEYEEDKAKRIIKFSDKYTPNRFTKIHLTTADDEVVDYDLYEEEDMQPNLDEYKKLQEKGKKSPNFEEYYGININTILNCMKTTLEVNETNVENTLKKLLELEMKGIEKYK